MVVDIFFHPNRYALEPDVRRVRFELYLYVTPSQVAVDMVVPEDGFRVARKDILALTPLLVEAVRRVFRRPVVVRKHAFANAAEGASNDA